MNIEQQAEEYFHNIYEKALDENWSFEECLKEAYIAGYNQALINSTLNIIPPDEEKDY